MNISGGTSLSLYEVHEAAEIVSAASDAEVNMIFGSIINENLKDEIVVTVIATGFDDTEEKPQRKTPSMTMPNKARPQAEPEENQKEQRHNQQASQTNEQMDTLDIPTFLRNRRNRSK